MENKKFKDILDSIEKMTILELNDLIKAIEEKFDVKAVMPAAGASDDGSSEAADSSTVSLILSSFGGSKITVIKAVMALLGVKLLEAKQLVEKAPVTLKTGLSQDEAKDFASKIQEAGGETEIK